MCITLKVDALEIYHNTIIKLNQIKFTQKIIINGISSVNQ